MLWSRGRCAAWDFTYPDTLASSHLNRAVTSPGEVVNDAEQKKSKKYTEFTAQYHFLPIAIETLGPVGGDIVRSRTWSPYLSHHS